MARLNVDEIFGDLQKKEIKKVAVERLGSSKYKLWIEHGSNKGDNFMGEIYRVWYCEDRDSDNSPDSVILKIAPKHLGRRAKFNLRNLFLREITMYDEVIAYFHEFQQFKGIAANEHGFNETTKCYHSIQNELFESLFLEDLKPKGFEMISLRNEPLTFDHVSLCLKALGKLHAVSFAIKDQQPQKFQELIKPIFEQYWTYMKTSFRKLYTAMLDRLISVLKDQNRPDLYEKVKRAIGENYFAKVFELTSSASAEPYAVLCHGDVTTNNVMFKKNEHGKPIEIQLFDWQFSRYASPVTDIVLFLLCSTSKELRDQHYDDFLKIYHRSLSDLLERLGSDPQKIFPYHVFLDQMQKYAIYSMFMGTKLFPLLFADIETMPNVDEISDDMTPDEYIRVAEHSKKTYNERIVTFFDDMARFGYM